MNVKVSSTALKIQPRTTSISLCTSGCNTRILMACLLEIATCGCHISK
ncbi:MAG: gallidermin/nisin family lantibiotic [Pseudolactococcus laudensis]|nr:lantibiotic nisin-A [Lactococcus laudensis]